MNTLLSILGKEVKGLAVSNTDSRVMICYSNATQLKKVKNVLYFLNSNYDIIEANKCLIVKF